MWTYYRLFFSRNYWVLVRRRHFWRDSWMALRRAHKDKRARKQLRLLFTVVTTPLFCLFFTLALLVGFAAAAVGHVGLSAGILAGSVVGFIRSRNARREAEITKLFEPEEEPDWVVSAEVRRSIAEHAMLAAVMSHRAGSELFLAEKTLPEGFTVLTRRMHVDVLKSLGIWDRLGANERDLLLRADGHWEGGVAHQIQWSLEPVRLLRWVLRVDEFLPVVGKTLDNDFAMARELVLEPEKLFNGPEIISRKNMQVVRQAARTYFQRCAAEGVSRGYFAPESEENAEWSKNYAARLAGRQSEDLLLGTKLVSEADEGTVQVATMLALRRLRVCDWVIGVLSNDRGTGEELILL